MKQNEKNINKVNMPIIIIYLKISWGLGIGDWGLGIGDWAQSPIPNPQIPNPQSPIPIYKKYRLFKNNDIKIIIN